jgi:hypothetical protein
MWHIPQEPALEPISSAPLIIVRPPSEFFSVVQRRAPSLRRGLADASDGSLWSS